jgi:hypothetical protein
MKNKSNFLLLSTLIGGLLFNYLFWTEDLGLNLLIYSLYILSITYFNTEIIKSRKFTTYAISHLFAAILVVIINSDLSIVAYYISLLLFIGFSHYQQIKTVFIAIMAVFVQFLTLPFNVIQNLTSISIGSFNLRPVLKLVKYILVPLFIVSVFTIIYSDANQVFAHYLDNISTSLSLLLTGFLDLFFVDFNFNRLLFVCLGLVLTGGLLLTCFNKKLGDIEQNSTEDLERIRRNNSSKTIWYQIIEIFSGNLLYKKLALKTEYITGIISFIALNILLLIINTIDICTLWLGFKPSGNFSADLHDGTNALIFSIIMAMAVIIYFFRGNLNFYSKSKTLRLLAFTWMVQNSILIVSVLIRDGYYIEFYGLTHKRIGVMVFALLCIIGLVTVYIKVAKQKTLFYLFKINGHIWFALLLGFSLVSWDVFIAKYNFNHSESKVIDPDYLLSLSDRVLPLLDQNRNKLLYDSTSETNHLKPDVINPNIKLQEQLDRRIDNFGKRYRKTSWLSWNLSDGNTANYFGL